MTDNEVPNAVQLVIWAAEATGHGALADRLRTYHDWAPNVELINSIARSWDTDLAGWFAASKTRLQDMKNEALETWSGAAAGGFVRHIEDTLACHDECLAAAAQVAEALRAAALEMQNCVQEAIAAVTATSDSILGTVLLGSTGVTSAAQGLRSAQGKAAEGALSEAVAVAARRALPWAGLSVTVSVLALLVPILVGLSARLDEIMALIDRRTAAALADLRTTTAALAKLKVPSAMADVLREPTVWIPKTVGLPAAAPPPGFTRHLADIAGKHFGKDVHSEVLHAFEAGFDLDDDQQLDDDEYLLAAKRLGEFSDKIKLDLPADELIAQQVAKVVQSGHSGVDTPEPPDGAE